MRLSFSSDSPSFADIVSRSLTPLLGGPAYLKSPIFSATGRTRIDRDSMKLCTRRGFEGTSERRLTASTGTQLYEGQFMSDPMLQRVLRRLNPSTWTFYHWQKTKSIIMVMLIADTLIERAEMPPRRLAQRVELSVPTPILLASRHPIELLTSVASSRHRRSRR